MAADITLALEAAAGNVVAIETLVRSHNRLLFRTARGVVPDDAEAQDVVQETYIRALGNLRSYRGKSSLATWLARIAINVAISTLRKKGRFVKLRERSGPAGEAFPEDAMPTYTPDDETPCAMAERQEMRVLLQGAIAQLPVIYRTVFMLRAVEELSVEDTAQCLDVSEDVVKTRFLRARGLLREALSSRIEAGASDTFTFAGERCDAVLAHVMTELLRQGFIRLH